MDPAQATPSDPLYQTLLRKAVGALGLNDSQSQAMMSATGTPLSLSGSEVLAATQSARDILNPTTSKVMSRMYEAAKPTFQAMKNQFAGDRTVGGIQGLAGRMSGSPAAETLGEVLSDFTPVGGEALYNVGKGAVVHQPSQDPSIAAYARLLLNRGR